MIKMGQQVKDVVSGFSGIAVGRSIFLNGCARVSVQPKVTKDGKLPDDKWFDEPQLKVVGRKRIKPGPQDTGGPIPSIPTRRSGE